MLEKLPPVVGRSLHSIRPGLEKTIFFDPEVAAGSGAIVVTSPAFADYEEMPARFTGDAEGISPPIEWSGVPGSAQSVVIVIEDGDSPTPSPLVHAIVWGLYPADGQLEEGALRDRNQIGEGLAMGKNSYMSEKYLAPDPPPGHGRHRYAIQVFALDCEPDLGPSPGRSRLVRELKGHVMAKGLLVGTYERAA